MCSWKCDTTNILDFVTPIQNVLYNFFSALSLFYLEELEKFLKKKKKPLEIEWTKYLVFCCSASQRLYWEPRLVSETTGTWKELPEWVNLNPVL